jgi:hypothetical protein
MTDSNQSQTVPQRQETHPEELHDGLGDPGFRHVWATLRWLKLALLHALPTTTEAGATMFGNSYSYNVLALLLLVSRHERIRDNQYNMTTSTFLGKAFERYFYDFSLYDQVQIIRRP